MYFDDLTPREQRLIQVARILKNYGELTGTKLDMFGLWYWLITGDTERCLPNIKRWVENYKLTY